MGTYDDWKSTEDPEQTEAPEDGERIDRERREANVELWQAIRAYVHASGGDPWKRTDGAAQARPLAARAIDRAVRKLEDLAVEAAGVE